MSVLCEPAAARPQAGGTHRAAARRWRWPSSPWWRPWCLWAWARICKLLARIAGGVLWVGAVLAALLSLDRLFQGDFDDGSLELIALSPLSLEQVALAKMLAHWLSTGLPLTLLSPLLALLFGLPVPAMQALLVSLLIGTPAVSAIGAIGASLTLSLKRGGLILPLIVLPLLAPAVIFGAGA